MRERQEVNKTNIGRQLHTSPRCDAHAPPRRDGPGSLFYTRPTFRTCLTWRLQCSFVSNHLQIDNDKKTCSSKQTKQGVRRTNTARAPSLMGRKRTSKRAEYGINWGAGCARAGVNSANVRYLDDDRRRCAPTPVYTASASIHLRLSSAVRAVTVYRSARRAITASQSRSRPRFNKVHVCRRNCELNIVVNVLTEYGRPGPRPASAKQTRKTAKQTKKSNREGLFALKHRRSDVRWPRAQRGVEHGPRAARRPEIQRFCMNS
ncbi:hypothetical protein EVAR_33098_1 [Eumeta japonica]|uniref:Uncharacterized protein n=1 Tax=Eumeta variegata TaxID=151549 RepID=A0A4C1YD66_EUMVA|nr:hypothetical protein EVAR_33098_1 [Eumeta japonica]